MTSPTGFPAWVDGVIVPHGAPALSVEDLGFQLGFAVFDTLVQEDGYRIFEELHLARLEAGARALSMDWPPRHDPAQALDEFAHALDDRDCVMRITFSRGVPGAGTTLVVGARALVRPPAEGVVVTLERDAKVAGHQLENIKVTSRLRNVLAREAAQARGAWEALLCTQDGDVAEGTVSNLFVVTDGRVVTPSTERGCLAGITRDLLIDDLEECAWPLDIGRIEVADLARADEVFLTNTSGRLTPVTAILGSRSELPGPRGPVFRELASRFRALEERYRSSRSR